MKAFSPIRPYSLGDTGDHSPLTPNSSKRFSLTPEESSIQVDDRSERPTNSHGTTVNKTAMPVGPDLSSSGIHLMPVSSSTLLLTLNQLAVMSRNGVEIAEAVGHVAHHCQDPRLAASLDAIYLAIRSGSTFSNAVAMHGRFFPPSLPAMLTAAETTGEVPNTLEIVCERMRDEIEMRASIIGVTIYPVILIAAAIVVMTALFLGVLPSFGRVFESLGKPVPASTQFMLDVGTFGRKHWIDMLACGLAFMTAIVFLSRHPIIRGPIGRLMLYAPVIKDAYRPLIAGRIFRTIAAMIRGGVPLLQAVRLTRETVTDHSWHDLLGRVEANLIDGLNASEALSTADFLPSEATQMMATGERTGRVPDVLEDIGKFYEQEGRRRTKRLVVALEPMVVLVMGIVVAVVVISVMLPILDVSTIQSG